jgi:hypothetical protein
MSKHKSRISDAPELDPRVRQLLSAAAAPAETAGPLPGEDEALAVFRTSPQPARRGAGLRPHVSAKAAVAAAISAGALLTGVGAAAAGVLPGAVQDTVSEWLEPIGVPVPAGERADENRDPRGGSEEAPGASGNRNGDQGGGSEEAPGARNNEDGDHCGRSVETPGYESERPPTDKGGPPVSSPKSD